jgi:methionyl-tRNA formyltransferase
MANTGGLKNIVLFLNNDIGLKVFQYLLQDDKVQIIHVYLINNVDEINSEILKLCDLNGIEAFVGKEIIKDIQHLLVVKEKDIDFIVSVYWPWLINDLYLAESKDSLNFHPALLPKNRGWYPHVHNLINDTPAGVTLHRMSSVADAGDIWGQKVTFVNDTDNAKDLYERLKQDIYILFSEIWPKIIQGLVVPFKQDEKKSTYNKKTL